MLTSKLDKPADAKFNMSGKRSGATVSFRAVDNFDQLPEGAASKILYKELVPACEAKGVKLSSYGNHAGAGSIPSVEVYNKEKANRELFDEKRVQKAYTSIPSITQNTSRYMAGSYGLKHAFEDHPSQSQYLRNGDLIAAMLVNGHQARFGKRTETMGVNCAFKVKEKEQRKYWK